MATNYQLKQGETPAQYRERNGLNTPAPTPDSGNAFMEALQKKLMDGAEAVNSSTSNIESAIQKTMSGVQSATDMESKRIESSYGRQIGYAQDTAEDNFQDFSENRSGFGTQMAAFRNLVQTTDKELKDLEQRKQEAILANNSAGASKIAELELKSLDYKMQAKQKVFDNLLSLSNFGLSAGKMAEDKRQFEVTHSFNQQKMDQEQRNKMGEIAANYGVELKPGDTIESVIARAMPFASERRQLELQKIRSEIQANNAQTAKILKGEADAKPFDAETAKILATAFKQGNTSFLGGLKTPEQAKAVYAAYLGLQTEETNSLKDIASTSSSPEEFMEKVQASGTAYDKTLVETVAATIAVGDEKGIFEGLFGNFDMTKQLMEGGKGY
jgi:cytochrome c556